MVFRRSTPEGGKPPKNGEKEEGSSLKRKTLKTPPNSNPAHPRTESECHLTILTPFAFLPSGIGKKNLFTAITFAGKSMTRSKWSFIRQTANERLGTGRERYNGNLE